MQQYPSYGSAPTPPATSRSGLRWLGLLAATLVVIAVAASGLPSALAQVRTTTYPRPNIKLNVDGTIPYRTDATIQFSTSANSGHDLTYSWDFGDGETMDNANPNVTHSYSQYGDYQVVVMATDPIGQAASDSYQLQVYPPSPLASFTISAAEDRDSFGFLNGYYVTLNAGTSTGADLTYTWTYSDGGQDSGVGTQFYYYCPYSSPFQITLTVTDGAGQTDSTTKPIGFSCQ